MKTPLNLSILVDQAESALNQTIIHYVEDTHGADNTVIFITTGTNEEFVVKCGEEVVVDMYILGLLTKHHAKAPRLIKHFNYIDENHTLPAIIMTKMAGTVLRYAPTEDKPYYITQVVQEMKKIHSIPVMQNYGKVEDVLKNKKISWAEFLNTMLTAATATSHWETMLKTFPNCRPVLEAALKRATESLEHVSANPPFALLHCDMHHRNIFIKDHEVEGIIDWSVACIGDPLYDFARFKMFIKLNLDKQSLDAFTKTLACDTQALETLDTYYLFWLIDYLHWYFIDNDMRLFEKQMHLLQQYLREKGIKTE